MGSFLKLISLASLVTLAQLLTLEPANATIPASNTTGLSTPNTSIKLLLLGNNWEPPDNGAPSGQSGAGTR